LIQRNWFSKFHDIQRSAPCRALEKQFDLPALFIDRGNRGGAELHQIGQQDDLALVFAIPNDDAT
jgi:hypothetical protein